MQAKKVVIQKHEQEATTFKTSVDLREKGGGNILIPCLSKILVKSIGEDNGNSNKVSQTGKIFMVSQVFNGNTREDTTMIL